MHGLGNDFVVMDSLRQSLPNKLPVARWADRHTGIGFDQLLLVEPSAVADVSCQIFNADGSKAEQCGNGMRCIARFVHEETLVKKKHITIETEAGIITADIKNYDNICINMGVPQLKKDPINAMMDGSLIAKLTILSLGNPHAIQRVDTVKDIPVTAWGKRIASHAAFTEGGNVGCIEVLSRTAINLRTLERGAGETQACGSNACAAVIAGIANGWLDNKVEVNVAQGKLGVEWLGGDNPVFLTGPAARVYSGVITLS